MSKRNRNRRARAQQRAKAERDVYAAGRDQTIINDNRRVEVAAGAVPHPATVGLAGPVAGLPRRPAQVFEGRAEALGMLRAALGAQGGAVVAQAVFGLGGVGKSELALQYAHVHRTDYRLVWWITAADNARVQAGLAGLAGRLCPMVALAGTTADAATWAIGWLQTHDGWLLILDNVEDPADIQPVLGQAGAGHVVITTRRDTDWGQLADPVRLNVLDPGAAVHLLLMRTGKDSTADEEAAAGIAEALGSLPLALDQAAAYIIQQRITLADYLDRLRRNPARMHAARTDVQRTVARLWDLHITAIQERDPAAAQLLGALAWYAPDEIPRVMIGGAAPRDDTDEALGLLASYSMITLTVESVSIHRLLQAVILTQPDDAGGDARGILPPLRRRWGRMFLIRSRLDAHSHLIRALDWLIRVIPADPETNMADWPLLRSLVPHAEMLAGHFPRGREPSALARVLYKVAVFLDVQGDYEHALPLGQRALAIAEAALWPGHKDTASYLTGLAVTYRDLGRLGDALPLLERALAIDKAALGPDHPTTATAMNNLAITYRDLGRAADALPLDQQALAITEARLGRDHPDTAARLGGLADTYRDLGRAADALPLEKRALAIAETAVGPDHPITAKALNNLAATYLDLGRAADALLLQQRALAINKAALGPDHPETAITMNNLAITYQDLGRPADALPLLERALAINKAALGPDHPTTVRTLNNLATVGRRSGR